MRVVLIAILLAVSGAPPTYLVERVVTAGGGARRVSVFRDGTAVVSVSEGGARQELHRRRLQPLELRVLAQVVEECYGPLKAQGSQRQAVGGAWQEYRLAPLGQEPLELRLSLLGAPSDAEMRLNQALDQVDNLLVSLPTPVDDFSAWQPRPGDAVELADGRVAVVRAVVEGATDPVVEVAYGDDQGSAMLELSELRRQAVRRVTP